MKTLVDAVFQEEAQRASLRYRCDDCVHFDDQNERCAHGYPTLPHRKAHIVPGSIVIFCKEFELGATAS